MSNEILKFCYTDTGTNLLTQSEYDSDSQRPIGNQPGIARDKFVNKVLRQTSFMSKVFADYLIQQTGGDVLDNADDATLLAKITQTFATGLPIASIIDMTVPQVPTGFLKCNGGAYSRTAYSALFDILVTQQGFTLQEFTVSIDSPAVVTKTAHGFTGGERLRLSTTGTLPTGLDTNTDYFVWYIDANTFRLQTMSNILAGTFVNTSGVQSGTHSYLQSLWGLGDGATTFNVPDIRGVFRRAWDDGRGIDPSRAIATLQTDAFRSHTHVQNAHTHSMKADANVAINGTGLAGDFRPGNGKALQSSVSWFNSATAVNQNTGGSETRPMNVTFMPVIKY